MHIIKITPKSFKIILSKEDLQRFGAGNIFDYPDMSGELFTEIIERTNALYGSPFTEGAIDAEFFESKEGGGELFITKHVHKNENAVYIFTTKESDRLYALCKRLRQKDDFSESRLYHDGNVYQLVLRFLDTDEITKSVIREYGDLKKAGKMNLWQIEEHSSLICESEAVTTIAEKL